MKGNTTSVTSLTTAIADKTTTVFTSEASRTIYISETETEKPEVVVETRDDSGVYRKVSKYQKSVCLAACIFLSFSATGFMYGLAVLYVDITQSLNVSKVEAALLQSVTRGLLNGPGIIYGVLLKRFDPLVCIAVGTLMACIGFVAASFSNDIAVLIFAIGVVAGIGQGLVFLASSVVVGPLFGSKGGLAVSLAMLGTGIAQCVMPYIIELLTQVYQWNGATFIYGGFILNNFVAVMLMRISLPSKGLPTAKQTNLKKILDVELFRTVEFDLYLPCIVLLGISVVVELWFLVDTMVEKGFTREDGSLLLSLLGFGGLFGRFMVWPIHEQLSRVSSLVPIATVSFLVGVCHMLIVWFDDYWPLFGASMFYGILLGAFAGFAPVSVIELAGLEKFAVAQGMFNTIYGIANAVSGPLFGAIFESTGSYDIVYYLAAACEVAVTGLCLFIMLAFTQRKSKTFALRS